MSDEKQESGWQPIESAPRDGTQILGWTKAWANHVQNVWWYTGLERWNTTMQPTHWMPLPSPPSESENLPPMESSRSATAAVAEPGHGLAEQTATPQATLTAEQLEAIRARADAATPGRWGYDLNTFIAVIDGDEWGMTVVKTLGTTKQDTTNGDFIANARQDIPELLTHIDSLSAAIKSAESATREECCKAVCIGCVDSLELDHDERGYFHVSNQGEYGCRASGIRTLGEK